MTTAARNQADGEGAPTVPVVTPARRPSPSQPRWERPALAGVLLIAALLNVVGLARVGFGNTYYAAAVRSMLQSWHNFFFVAFDPGGFVTVDKPPVGLWLQALSAKMFGFSGVSLMLPQAIAGVVSVLVLYHLVRRAFGPAAGLLAGLALAITPVAVAAARNNIVDGTLALAVLVAAWATVKAAETGRLRWLLLAAALVGIGFNIKMLEAYLVVPALGLLFLLAAPRRPRVRLAHLALAAVVLAAVSLSWSAAVDLTPASQRPYVGSSQTNSELNLAFGYNGVARVTGNALPNGRRERPAVNADLGGFMRGFSAGETGAASPGRLLNDQLGGEASWLLPLAMLGLLASGWGLRGEPLLAAWRERRLRPHLRSLLPLRLDRRCQAFVLWGAWFLTTAAFFSVAGFFHTYYLVMLAPPVAALAGIGAVLLWRDYRTAGWRGWLLPLALVLTAALQAKLLDTAPDFVPWLRPLLLALALVAAALLTWHRLAHRLADHRRLAATPTTPDRPRARHASRRAGGASPGLALAAAGIAALLLAPTAWSVATAQNATGLLPTAGPVRGGNPFARLAASIAVRGDSKLVSYLESHEGRASYLFATLNAATAAPYIIETGKPVMALGGFIGADDIVSTARLKQLVAGGQVRYFLLPSFGGLSQAQLAALPAQIRQILGSRGAMRGLLGANADAIQWVTQTCTAVPRSLWSLDGATAGFPRLPGGAGGFPGSGAGGGGQPNGSGLPDVPGGQRGGLGGLGGEQLYDCAGHV